MFRKVLIAVILFILFLAIGTATLIKNLNEPPEFFPVNEPVVIEPGTNVRDITQILWYHGVVRSPDLLYYVLVLFHDPADIKASAYLFTEPLTTVEVAKRLTEGDFDTDLIQFTHFEGERASKLVERASAVLTNFDSVTFLEEAEPYEGRLFPDTYYIPKTFTHSELLELMLNTYAERVHKPYYEQKLAQRELTEDEMLVLASIVEREANTTESMKMVAGILLNRLRINMPLQADASIEYILDKPLGELTPEDLEIDSPYNTYTNTGLPPTPIGNPGLDAILAVIEPTWSDYYYYITDTDGVFHYAKTYNEHLLNIERYLR
jgi:UPF0755 protein